MTLATPVRIACVGAGWFSRLHRDAWARIVNADTVAAVDRDLQRAAATGLRAFDDFGDMMAEMRPDLVDIITPPPSHLDLIRRAVTGGAKAVICQKPFCASLDEAQEAARLSRESGVPVIVHENFRFQPWYRRIRAGIDEGLIGEVLQITFRLRPGDGQGPEAYLARQPYFQQMPRFLVHETAVHWIDTFRYLLGEPESVYADLHRLNPAIAGEDAGHILFSYPGGRRALFDGNRLLDHPAENTRCTMGEALVEGTRGTISLDGSGRVTLRPFGKSDQTLLLEAGDQTVFGGDCVYHLQKHVIDSLLHGTALENTAADYLPVLRQEAAIYQSAHLGRKVSTAD